MHRRLLKHTHRLQSAIVGKTKAEDQRSRHILMNAIMLSEFTTSEPRTHKLLKGGRVGFQPATSSEKHPDVQCRAELSV